MFAVCPHSRLQRACAVIAALFGIVTIFAGGRVLLGLHDPGYFVLRPVLIFNTAMGVMYVVAAVLMTRTLESGRIATAIVASLNLAVLIAIVVYWQVGGTVARETLTAMTFRTAVWFVILFALYRVSTGIPETVIEA